MAYVCKKIINKIKQIIFTSFKSPKDKQVKPNILSAKHRNYTRRRNIVKKRLPRCPVKDKFCYNEILAKQMANKKTNQIDKIRAYKCEFCNYWHLTHKPDKKKWH